MYQDWNFSRLVQTNQFYLTMIMFSAAPGHYNLEQLITGVVLVSRRSFDSSSKAEEILVSGFNQRW